MQIWEPQTQTVMSEILLPSCDAGLYKFVLFLTTSQQSQNNLQSWDVEPLFSQTNAHPPSPPLPPSPLPVLKLFGVFSCFYVDYFYFLPASQDAGNRGTLEPMI
jgi:hypothetical protein